MGRLITRTRIVSSLATRLRIEDWHRHHPEMSALQIRRPVVIVGLPRTGTTLLQRLLAADPRNRALRSWEALEPAPVGTPGGPERKRRVGRATMAERALKWMAPDFFAVHPVEALAPEEEVLLLDLSFRSTVPEATLRVPSFARWLETQDQAPAYRYLVRALQLLTWQEAPREDEGGHWVLKTPHHLEWLDVLLDTFPDALVVWTQRDPKTVAASFCSMLAHGRGVFSDEVDPLEIGREWTRKSERMLGRGREVRARLGDASFMVVAYEDLVADPIAIARAIAARRGSTLSAEAERAMRSFLAVQQQHRHGVHRYDARDFGLED